MNMNLKSAIEGLLFVHGQALTASRLAKIIGAPKSEVEVLLRELQDEYRERGIIFVENDGEWQLATHPKNKPVVEKLLAGDRSEDLSRASLEVLAMVAYRGPISRARIEYIRGVNSSFTLQNLLIRGLVAREENPRDRRAYLYRISTDFLNYLGVSQLQALPNYEEFRKENIAGVNQDPPPELQAS